MSELGFHENLNIKYNTLTKQGKKIADFMRQNPNEAVRMTAKSLAEASGTSAAAVVRLCQQLGYENLEGMKISLAKGLNSDDLTLPMDTIVANGDSLQELAQKLYGNVHNALRGTLELVDYDAVKKAVQILQKASVVYLFGVGGSGLAASDFCHKLNRIGKTCIYLSDSHTNLEFASVATKKDAIVAFSYSGETKEVYLAAQWAQKKGVPVISVTRACISTLSALSTITLSVPEGEKRVRVGAFGSIFSQIFIEDILYLGIIQKSFGEYEDMLVQTSRIVNQLRG